MAMILDGGHDKVRTTSDQPQINAQPSLIIGMQDGACAVVRVLQVWRLLLSKE